MALLQRTRLLPNERLDLPDYNRIEDFVCADMKAMAKQTLSNGNFVFEGFVSTGVGTNTLSVVLAGSSLVMGANDGAVFIGAPSLSPLATTSLTPSATNYVEVFLDQDTGGADSRAFWDQTAGGGAGAEFSQIIDTFTFLKANLAISITNFSGASDRAKICEVDVNGSGVITAIRDRRDLFYRLGRGTNPTFAFPWTSRTEPSNTSFAGADKDIKNQKQLDDAFADSIREIKGTTYWFEAAPITLTGSFRNTALSMLTAATSSASFAWDGSALSITDSSGSPLDSDVLAYIRLFDVSSVIGLTRQDSSGGSATIPIAADQVLWVQLPDPLANVNYDSVGATSTNYRVSARGSVPLNQDTFWLAFREGNKLYVRGLGELDPGESHEISDETTKSLAEFLGFNPETATFVPYTEVPGEGLPATWTTSSDLVTAISAIAVDLNFIEDLIDSPAYDERLTVVSGAPVNTTQVTGPVSSGSILSLPLNSRNGDATQFYIVGNGDLEIYLNGIYLFEGIDWLEIGTAGNPSSTFQIMWDLVIGDLLDCRIDTTGGIISTGGGGENLQTAYNFGNIITTTGGLPFTVGGAAAKVAQFNGDIGIAGVIDPTGITFSRQGSDPLPSQDGFWVNSSGELMYKQNGMGSTNVSQVLGGASTSLANESQVSNHSGSTLTRGTPIAVDINGYAAPIDVSSDASAMTAYAVTAQSIADTATGSIVTSGVLPNILGVSFGDVLYVSKAGSLTSTKPSIGVSGFLAGDWIIKVGVVQRNVTTPTQKDLIVNIQTIAQL